MNPEDSGGGGSSAVGATSISPLAILQRDQARRAAAVVKGGGQAQEAGGLLGTETNDLFAGASFDLSDSDDNGPPRSSFAAEAGDWFETKFQLRICGHRLGAGAAKKVIFALAALLCVFVLVVLVGVASGDDDDAGGLVPVATPRPVRAQLTVEVDIAYIAPDTAARASFELHFREDVAARLRVGTERVVIESIEAGSVLVTFSVLPDATGTALVPTVISSVFGGGQQVTVSGYPVTGLALLDASPAAVSQSPAQGAVDAPGGCTATVVAEQWRLEAFDGTTWSGQAIEDCIDGTRGDGFLSTCGNYKNNGCWGAVGRQCPRGLAAGCENFSARFSSSLSVPTAADYRFFVSMDDRADIKINGELVFSANCEWVGSSCAQQTFDRSLDAGSHEILVEYIQEDQGAYADLKWVELGQPCPEDQWRVELYTNEDFTSDPGSTIQTTCEPMQAVASHRTGSLQTPRPWCPVALGGQCDYFSAIYTLTTSFPEAGMWLFDLSTSGESWVALDDVHLTPSGCANLVGGRCETSTYSHRIDDAGSSGAGTHKISVFFTHIEEDPDSYMRLDWVSTGEASCVGWEVAIYNAPNLEGSDYIESICIDSAEQFLNTRTSGVASGAQISPCNLEFSNGGDCWCPEGLTTLDGDMSRCQHWSATFTRVITLTRGGMYRFLSRANLASSAAQVLISIDGQQVAYGGCILNRGICDQSIFETGNLATGDHTVVVTLDDSGPALVELEWQQIDHGCAANEWRVEGMRSDVDRIVSVACVTYDRTTGFLELPDDFCPHDGAAVDTCAVDRHDFRAAFTTTVSFSEAGIYRFSQRFRDTGVVFIDGVRMQSSGCQNAFGSRCTETTFDHVLTRGDHIISVDLEFEDPQDSKKVLGQLQWLNLGTGDCEWQHVDWSSGNYGGAHEVRTHGELWGGSPITQLGDDDYFTKELPFAFPFYGGTKGSVRINANGYLTFSGDHHGYGNTASIPDPGPPNDMIAVYWTDLNPEHEMCEDPEYNCEIYTYWPPSNRDIFVIQWDEIPFYQMADGIGRSDCEADGGTWQARPGGAGDYFCFVEPCTFSCILHRNGTIEMEYRHVPTPEKRAPHSDYASVSIGIEGPAGTMGLQVSYGSPLFPDDRVALLIPQSCNVEQCGRNEWFMELFSDTDFSTPVSTTCENFDDNTDGHLLTCADYRNGGCWCPQSLMTYDTHLNYVVSVGASPTDEREVTVPGAEIGLIVLECGQRPVNYQSPDWLDSFSTTPIGGGRVRVIRTDQHDSPGWGQDLQIMCTVEYTTDETPVAGECRHFSAILTAPRVKFDEAGLYRFHESSHDEAVVYIDGERVHSAGCDWLGSHCAESEIDVELTAGVHALQYSFVAYTGRAYAYLAWEHIPNPCPAGTWRQELFDNTDFTSPASDACHSDACRHSHMPVHVSCETFTDSDGQAVPFIETCSGHERPGCWCPDGLTEVPGTNQDQCHHFSARLMSTVNITSGGLYRFHVKADDEAEVFINGELHQSLYCGDGASSGGACKEYTFEATLSKGEHSVMFEFVKYDGGADASLTWEQVEGFQCMQLVTAGDEQQTDALPLGEDKSVIFQLQAAGEAHLIFTEGDFERAGSYHIVLGASTNQAVSISKTFMYNQKATAETPGILHSYGALPFWASAQDGLVRVGMGNTLGVGVLLEWYDYEPLNIVEVTVQTALQYRGDWQLCSSAACGPGEWRQELFQGAAFDSPAPDGVSCVRYDTAGFLNTCEIVADNSDRLLSHVDLVVSSREDTAEECVANGAVFLSSSDLELLWDREDSSGGACPAEQQVAVRFRGVEIQPESNGLHVRSATLTLIVDEFHLPQSDGELTVMVEAEADDDSRPFDGADRMVTSRQRTTARIPWTLPANAQVGDPLASPNLGPVIQEVLNRPGWHYGNSLTLFVSLSSGTGNRWVLADSAVLAVDFVESAIGRGAPGCWTPGGAGFDHDTFSAILTTDIQIDESSRYRFVVDNDATAVVSVSVDGREIHSSGCEMVGGQCGNRIFDASLDYGTHEVSVRFAEREGNAHLSLSWEAVSLESMRECYENDDASDYRGRQAITSSGYGCADWACTPGEPDCPHAHADYNTAESSPEAGLLDNYCRNPNGRSTAWCYTTDPAVAWDLCMDIGPPSDSCDVCSANKWFMEVFDNADFTGLVASECVDAGEFLHISPFCPDALQGRCDYVSATFTRTIQVGDCIDSFKVCHPGGVYRFFETSGHDSKVFLDGELIHESVCDNGRCSTHNFEVELDAGLHTIMYDLQGYDGVAYADLKWEHVGSSQCRYRRVSSDWVDATVGTAIPPLEDDDAHTIPLPFEGGFPYYGGVKTHVKVSSNGYLTFSGDHFSYGDTSAVPSTQVPNDFIAPYWTDLNPEAGGDIYFYHYEHTTDQGQGQFGNTDESSRTKFVVQWNAVPYYCTEDDCPTVTFQVLLYPSGAIKFQYLDMPPNPNIHGRPVVGIENGEGDAGILMSHPPEGALNDPSFVGADASGGARLAYYVPRPCEVRDCGAGSWRVEVFRGDDFTLPASTSCRNFERNGFLATSLACGGWMTASLGWHRIVEPCWCPAALQTYVAGGWAGEGRRRAQQGDDSCATAPDGNCDEPFVCAEGTDTTDCSGYQGSNPYCPYTDDGECDEITYCPSGTDTNDCCENGGVRTQDADGHPIDSTHVCCAACPLPGDDWCQFANDGVCDEPEYGRYGCAAGSDTTDCANAEYVCPYTNDDECDETTFCRAGTDTQDCCDGTSVKVWPASSAPSHVPGTPVSEDADCSANAAESNAGDDSCLLANNNVCDEPYTCLTGTDRSDCLQAGFVGSSNSYCPYTDDGECDEIMYCAPGSDAHDCCDGETPRPSDEQGTPIIASDVCCAACSDPGRDWCRWANDGVCDHPIVGTGECAMDSDATDCTQTDSFCQHENDGHCDEIDLPGCGGMCCPAGTDTADCCDATGHVKVDSTGQPVSEDADCPLSEGRYVSPVVDIVASSLTGITAHTTYRLSLALGEQAGSVYTIFGLEDHPMQIPAAYQIGTPWGADVGGVNPLLWAIDGHSDSQWDSWLTVTDVDGNQAITTVGIDFSGWNAAAPANTDLTTSDGAVFWMDPSAAPVVNSAVIAQLTIPQGSRMLARVSAQGRGPGGAMGDDWQQLGIEFSSAEVEAPGASAGPGTAIGPAGDPCEYFSAIFTTTMHAEMSGRYTIFETSHFSSSVFVDGDELTRLGCVYRDGQCSENMFSIGLQEGDHEIVVKFIETTGGAFSHVWWQYVGSDCDYSHGNYTETEWKPVDTYPGRRACNRDGSDSAMDTACEYEGLEDDDYVTAQLPVGWSFPFYGGHKTSVRVSTNGYLTFSGAHYSYGNTAPIPDAAAPNDMIAPFWTDLNPAEAGVGAGIFTYATAEEFVVLWKRIPLWGTDAVATFEVIMRPDGEITFLYEDVPFQMLDYAQPSVGLENSDGTQGLRISYADMLIPVAGMSISIPESCEHPAVQNGASQGARACEDMWSLEVYEGVDFMRADGASALVSTACLTPEAAPASTSDFSHSDPVTGFITADSDCPTATCPSWWQGDGECDTATMPSICPPGTDSVDCGDPPSTGCWCPAALQHYNSPPPPNSPPDFVPQSTVCTTFGAIYTRTIWIQTAGLYRFTENSPDEIAIFIDGEHLHRSGCVPGSKTDASHLTGVDYTMGCSEESMFEIELTAAEHTVVVNLVHHSNSMTAPPTLEWEFLGTAPCEWSVVPYDWKDEVLSSGQLILGSGIDVSAAAGVNQQLPETWATGFPFFGGQQHDINVFADGFLSFQTNEAIGDGSTQAFPSPVEPNNIIAPWWVDLDLTAGGGVYAYTPADESFWAVEWYNVRYFGSGLTVDFQAVLKEDGSITFSYRSLPAGPAAHSWAPPSIGLENVGGTDGLRIAYDPDPDLVLQPGVQGKPADQSSVEIPTECATSQCGLFHWVVAAYSDLTFSTALHTSCEDWDQGETGFLVAPDFCPVHRLADGTCPAYSAYFIQNVRFPRSGLYRFTENSPHTVGILFINDQQVLSSTIEPIDHLVDVRLAAGTYELMYGVLHLPATVATEVPLTLSWTSHSHGTCSWSSSDDDDHGDDGGADGHGGGAVPFDWVDLNSIGVCRVGSAAGCPADVAIGDDGFIDVVLPVDVFPNGFPFYGGRKTAVRVSANGYLTFSGEHLTYGDTQAIPSRGLPNDLIAVYWTDLDPSEQGSIYTWADTNRWIVEWHQIPLWGQPDSGPASVAATFEAILYPSGEIRMQYQSTPRSTREGDDVRSSPAVGIENVDGSEGEQIAWNDATFPVANTAITIPSECEIGGGTGECAENQWQVRVYHDLHFQMQVQEKCEHHRHDGQLQTCDGTLAELEASSSGCWCPAGLARYAGEAYSNTTGTDGDGCLYANDNECDVPEYCSEGTDINDCASTNTGCAGDSDGFSAILSRTVQIGGTEHGNYVFGALFGARSVSTVIIDDDVAFVWDARMEFSSACTGSRASCVGIPGTAECSCAAWPAFAERGLQADCPEADGCSFSSSPPPTLQTFDWHLTEGEHSIVVEYVEEAGADSGGNAYLTWTKA